MRHTQYLMRADYREPRSPWFGLLFAACVGAAAGLVIAMVLI